MGEWQCIECPTEIGSLSLRETHPNLRGLGPEYEARWHAEIGIGMGRDGEPEDCSAEELRKLAADLLLAAAKLDALNTQQEPGDAG